MVSQTDEMAESRLSTFLGLCDDLGVPMMAEKMEKWKPDYYKTNLTNA